MSEQITNDDDTLKRLQKYNAELEWFQHNYPELKKQYKGEYVAIEDEAVIAHNEDLKELLKFLKDKDMTRILIEHVNAARQLYVL